MLVRYAVVDQFEQTVSSFNLAFYSDGVKNFASKVDLYVNQFANDSGHLTVLDEKDGPMDISGVLGAPANLVVTVNSDLEPVPVPASLVLLGGALPLLLRGRKKVTAV